MKKNVLFLMAAMLLSVTSAFAQYGGTTGPLTWHLNTGTLTISGEGAIPDYEWGDAPWFEHREYIYTVIIEPGVTRIGCCAFFACVNITSITIPNSVTTIGCVAFYACNSLSSITIPNSVTTIEYFAFHNCRGLISITIPNSVITIEGYAFEGCEKLPSITIPSSVTSIGELTFKACPSLTSIDVESENKDYTSENGILFNKNKSTLVCYPMGKTEDFYVIPNSVTSTGAYAFYGCENLISITIPECVIDIDLQSFAFCKNLALITNFNPVPVAIDTYVFWGVDQFNCVLKVPKGSVSAYKNADVWKDFRNIIAELHLVSVSLNNDKYGWVTGGGMYDINTTATVKATAKSGYRFINWTKDGVEVSTNNSYSFTVTEDVELVANLEEGETGIVKTDNYPSLRVYPNPTTGVLHIETQCIASLQDMEIYDVFGRKAPLNPPEGGRLPSFGGVGGGFDISHLPSGIYFVRIQTDKGIITRKIVKQ